MKQGERCIDIGEYMVATGDTVRGAAKRFGVSKSTAHKDVSERLLLVNRTLHAQVQEVLAQNKSERHIRGGAATREKYKSQKQ